MEIESKKQWGQPAGSWNRLLGELTDAKDGVAVERVSELLNKFRGETIVIVEKNESGKIIKAQIDEEKL